MCVCIYVNIRLVPGMIEADYSTYKKSGYI